MPDIAPGGEGKILFARFSGGKIVLKHPVPGFARQAPKKTGLESPGIRLSKQKKGISFVSYATKGLSIIEHNVGIERRGNAEPNQVRQNQNGFPAGLMPVRP